MRVLYSWSSIGVFAVVTAVLLTPVMLYARAKEKLADPDYSHLEYAKPRPPADQQIPEPQPGSIQRRFGERKVREDSLPPDTLLIPLRRNQKEDEGEPPLTDLFNDDVAPSSPTVTDSTPAVSTPTVP